MTTQFELTACPSCDLLQRIAPLGPHDRAVCPRCGDVLENGGTLDLQFNLALAIAVLVLMIIANAFPVMSLEAFVKLGDIASVEPGPALYAFGALCVLSALSTSHLDSKMIWATRRRA